MPTLRGRTDSSTVKYLGLPIPRDYSLWPKSLKETDEESQQTVVTQSTRTQEQVQNWADNLWPLLHVAGNELTTDLTADSCSCVIETKPRPLGKGHVRNHVYGRVRCGSTVRLLTRTLSILTWARGGRATYLYYIQDFSTRNQLYETPTHLSTRGSPNHAFKQQKL